MNATSSGVEFFIFGKARGTPALMNAAVDGIIEKQCLMEWTPLDQIPYIYDNTTPGSPLRQLFIDFTIKHCKITDGSWFSEEAFGWYTKEFLFNLAVAHCEIRKGLRSVVDDFKASRCKYRVPAFDSRQP